jgi:hypothetical protein
VSTHDSWLLEGSEGAAWDEDSAPYGLAECCEIPLDANGGCPCNPCLTEEYIPVRASFEVAEGKVREL